MGETRRETLETLQLKEAAYAAYYVFAVSLLLGFYLGLFPTMFMRYCAPIITSLYIASALFMVKRRQATYTLLATLDAIPAIATCFISSLLQYAAVLRMIVLTVYAAEALRKEMERVVCYLLANASAALAATALMLASLNLLGHNIDALYTLPAMAATVIAPLAATMRLRHTIFETVSVTATTVLAPYTLLPLILIKASYLEANRGGPAPGSVNRGNSTDVCLGEIVARLAYPRKHFLQLNTYKPRWLKHALNMREDTRWFWISERPRCLKLRLVKTRGSHILVSGATGSGKTTTAKHLIGELIRCRGARIVIIDPHGEYVDYCRNMSAKTFILKAGEAALNPLQPPPGLAPQQHAVNLSYLFKSLFKLGMVQQNVLYSALLQAYIDKGIDISKPVDSVTVNPDLPNLDDLRRVLRELSSEDTRALQVLMYVNMFADYFTSGNKTYDLDHVLKEYDCVVIDLSSMPMQELRFLYTDTFIRQFYTYMLSSQKREHIDNKLYVLVIDEAHIVASKTIASPYALRVFTEMRKYNVAAVALTQQASKLHEEIVANSGYIIALRQVEPHELNYISNIISGVHDTKRLKLIEYTISSLPPGYAVVRDRDSGEVFIIHVVSARCDGKEGKLA